MIYFLYGANTYSILQKLYEIEAKFYLANKSGAETERIDATDLDFRVFWDKVLQKSLFVSKKLFVLENVFKDIIFKEALLEKIKNLAELEDIFVIVEKEAVSDKDKLFKELQKRAKRQEFKALSGVKLRRWVESEFSKFSIAVDPFALDMLLSATNVDLWQLSGEVAKLTAFASKSKRITAEDVELLVKSKNSAAEIFKTIDAVAERNKQKALNLIERHLLGGDDVFYLLSMFAFQLRNLILMKADSVKAKKEMHPFVAKKTYYQAQRFSMEELLKMFQKIFNTDLQIKTGQIKPEVGLRMLVAEM